MIKKRNFTPLEAIKELFGETVTESEARDIVEKRISGYRMIHPEIFDELTELTEEYEQSMYDAEKRHAAQVMVSEKYQVKSFESIIEKIWRNPKKYTVENFPRKMEDILRFRILCNYLCDVLEMSKILPETMKANGCRVLYGPKDFINMEPGARRKGYRAIHFVFKKKLQGVEYLFEVQIMTLLQHAWDKKDHHLVYEYQRINKEVPLELKMRAYAMSELLYVADDFFDSLLEGNKR